MASTVVCGNRTFSKLTFTSPYTHNAEKGYTTIQVLRGAVCRDALSLHDRKEIFANPSTALRVQNVEMLDDVIWQDIRLDSEFTLGDIAGDTKGIRNVLYAEYGKLKLI